MVIIKVERRDTMEMRRHKIKTKLRQNYGLGGKEQWRFSTVETIEGLK